MGLLNLLFGSSNDDDEGCMKDRSGRVKYGKGSECNCDDGKVWNGFLSSYVDCECSKPEWED